MITKLCLTESCNATFEGNAKGLTSYYCKPCRHDRHLKKCKAYNDLMRKGIVPAKIKQKEAIAAAIASARKNLVKLPFKANNTAAIWVGAFSL